MVHPATYMSPEPGNLLQKQVLQPSELRNDSPETPEGVGVSEKKIRGKRFSHETPELFHLLQGCYVALIALIAQLLKLSSLIFTITIKTREFHPRVSSSLVHCLPTGPTGQTIEGDND